MFDFLNDGLDCTRYLGDDYVVLDFETDTSHGDYGHPVHPDNQMLLACWKRAGGSTRSLWADEYNLQDLIADIESASFLVAHNAKYELGWLARAGLDLRNVIVFDTKIAEYVLLGNLASGDKMMIPRSTGLNECIVRRGGTIKDPVIDIMMKNGHNPTEMPRPWLEHRCLKDVQDTEWLFLDQRRALDVTNRLPVMWTRCIVTPLLADVEFEGMRLDAERVAEKHAEYTEKRNILSAQLDEMTGGINWASTAQLGVYLYETLGFKELERRGKPIRTKPSGRFPEGQRKTDDDTLEALKCTTKEQRAFIKLRRAIGSINSALVKNLDFFQGVCVEKGGVFHAVFNQTNTATHRLSSSGIKTTFEMFDGKAKSVQFQNMPRIFKDLIKAKEEGFKIAEWDGSQLEFRVGAFAGNDAQAKQDIDNHHDVHTFTARELINDQTAEIDKEQRQDAKEHTFKPLYGGSSGTTAEKRYYAAFKARYPDLAMTQKGWTLDVVTDKRLITPWGMRFYWPKASIRNDYINVTSSVYNYPIQCLATAEIIPIAMVYFWHRIREAGLEDHIRIVNTVHDSVICEVRDGYEDAFEQLAVQVWHDVYHYLREVYGLEFDVTLGTEVNIGSHWSAKGNYEQAYDINPNGEVYKHE